MSLIKVDSEKVALIRDAEVSLKRRDAYRAEADPLFFKAQRGEVTIDDWQSKIDEIKSRFPKDTQ